MKKMPVFYGHLFFIGRYRKPTVRNTSPVIRKFRTIMSETAGAFVRVDSRNGQKFLTTTESFRRIGNRCRNRDEEMAENSDGGETSRFPDRCRYRFKNLSSFTESRSIRLWYNTIGTRILDISGKALCLYFDPWNLGNFRTTGSKAMTLTLHGAGFTHLS